MREKQHVVVLRSLTKGAIDICSRDYKCRCISFEKTMPAMILNFDNTKYISKELEADITTDVNSHENNQFKGRKYVPMPVKY